MNNALGDMVEIITNIKKIEKKSVWEFYLKMPRIMSINLVKNTQQQSGAKALGNTSGAKALDNTSEAKASGKKSEPKATGNMGNLVLRKHRQPSKKPQSRYGYGLSVASTAKRRLPKDEGNPNPEEYYDDGTPRRQSRRPHPWNYNPLVPDGHLVLQETRVQDGFGNEGGDESGGYEGQYPDKEDVDAWNGCSSEEDDDSQYEEENVYVWCEEEDVDAWNGCSSEEDEEDVEFGYSSEEDVEFGGPYEEEYVKHGYQSEEDVDAWYED